MGTAAIPRTNPSEIPEPRIARLLFANTYLAPLWLIIRLYVGYEWLMAGWEKFTDPAFGSARRPALPSRASQREPWRRQAANTLT